MSAKYFRVGRPTDLQETNKIVEEHENIKKEVLKALDTLADEAEGLTLQHIEQELSERWWSGIGRTVVVVGGSFSLALLAFPVVSLLSAPAGIAACVVGYFIVGYSIYECQANSKKMIDDMKIIYKKVSDELDRYKDSQEKVFTDLESYDFSQGKDFEGNMERMNQLIKNTEKKFEYGCCNGLEDFLKKIKTQYLTLSPELKETLESEKFMMDLKELMNKGAGYLSTGTAAGGLIGDIAGAAGAAVHNAAGAVGSGIGVFALWGNLLQGVNILVNGAFLFNDIRKYIQLKKMREDWKKPENRKEILKEEKFKVYFELKKEIQEIGNQMRSNGY